jgi:hypothetical protein
MRSGSSSILCMYVASNFPSTIYWKTLFFPQSIVLAPLWKIIFDNVFLGSQVHSIVLYLSLELTLSSNFFNIVLDIFVSLEFPYEFRLFCLSAKKPSEIFVRIALNL